MAPDTNKALTPQQAKEKADQRISSRFLKEHGDTKRLKAPRSIDFDPNPAIEQTKADLQSIFSAPFEGSPDKLPSLKDIISYVDPLGPGIPDPFLSDVNRKAKAQTFIESLATDPFITDYVNARAGIFNSLKNDIKDKYDLLNLSVLDVNAKANALTSLYFKAKEDLEKQHQDAITGLDEWINNNYARLKEIYGDKLDDQKAKNQLKQALVKQLDEELKKEIAHLQFLQDAMTAACNDVSMLHQEMLYEDVLKNYNKATGTACVLFGDDPSKRLPTDGSRYDRNGNAFNTSKKIEIDYKDPAFAKLSTVEKQHFIFDRMQAFKADGYDVLNIDLGNNYSDSSLDFHAKPSGTKLARMHWRLAIEAGYEPDKINISGNKANGGVLHYKPDADDFRFHRRRKAMESYKDLEHTNPALYKLFVDSMEINLKKTNPSMLGPHKAPILTPAEVKMLRDLNDLKTIKDQGDLKEALEQVRPSLSRAIELNGNDNKNAETIRAIRADMIKNPFLRKVLQDAVLTDANGQILREAGKPVSVFDKLTKKQIDAINRMDFGKNRPRYETPDEVIEAINNEGLGVENNEVNNLKRLKFATGGGINTVKDQFLNPIALYKAQKENNGNVVAANTVPGLKSELIEHQKAIQGPNGNDGIIKKIDDLWADARANAPPGTLAGERAFVQGKINDERFEHKGNELLNNYHRLIWHAQNQVKALKQLCDKLGDKLKDETDPTVRQGYKALIDTYLKDIDAAVDHLNKAGILTADGEELAVEFNDDNRYLNTTAKSHGYKLEGLREYARELNDARNDLADHIKDMSGGKITKEHSHKDWPRVNPDNNVVIHGVAPAPII